MDLGDFPGVIFAATAYVGSRFSCYFHILLTSHILQNSHVEALCLLKNRCSGKNQKRKEVFGKKKKKKRRKRKEKKSAQRKKKEYHSVKKRKNSFVKATGTLVSRSISNKEVAVKPKFAYVIFQTRFPFLYASTGLEIKTLTIASNRNFESCMSIRCLAPQHISGFFIFAAGFSFAFGNFAHYCVVLLKAPLSNLI